MFAKVQIAYRSETKESWYGWTLCLIAFYLSDHKALQCAKANAQLLNPQPGLGFSGNPSIARDWDISNIQQDSHSPSPLSEGCRAAEAALLLWSSLALRQG